MVLTKALLGEAVAAGRGRPELRTAATFRSAPAAVSRGLRGIEIPPAAQAAWDDAIGRLEAEYGEAIDKWTGTVKDTWNRAQQMIDAGASEEETIHAVSGALAVAGAALAAIPAIGWIAGAVAAIAAALVEAIYAIYRWVESLSPDMEEVGVSLALQELGYGGDGLTVDKTALQEAYSDGWIFIAGDGNNYIRIPYRLQVGGGGTWEAVHREEQRNIERIRAWIRAHPGTTIGPPFEDGAESRANLRRLMPGGMERWAAMLNSDQSGHDVRATLGEGEALGKKIDSYFTYVAWRLVLPGTDYDIDTADGYVFGFKLSKMPPEMSRAVRAGMLSDESEWPPDEGAKVVLRLLKSGKNENNAEKQLIVSAAKWAAKEKAREDAAKKWSTTKKVVVGAAVVVVPVGTYFLGRALKWWK